MPKRNAIGDLNHDNWDQEDAPEDRGHFTSADKEVLRSRPVKVARRRTLEQEDCGTGGLFKSFIGFGSGGSVGTGETSCFKFSRENENRTTLPSSETSIKDKTTTHQTSVREQHLANLKGLNSGVLKWIQEHVTRDPYCVLTPVFDDYQRHLMEIEKKYPFEEEKVKETTSVKPSTNGDLNDKPEKSFSFGSKATPFSFTSSLSSTTNKQPSGSMFSLTKTAAVDVADKPKGLSFTSADSKPSNEAPFSFKASASGTSSNALTTCKAPAPFSFTTSKITEPSDKDTSAVSSIPAFSFKSISSSSSNSSIFQASSGPPAAAIVDDDEEYVPPKPEVKKIFEEDSVFTTRCKLFYKSGDQWKDKGVGNLHIKPISDVDDKFQLLIRADTNLGNVLLNILIYKNIPCKLQKNNVALVCVPNPPLNAKEGGEPSTAPVPMLIRVKTEEAATDLLSKIDFYRGVKKSD